ncbi:MAG: helix-turn-helix domain-containing protein [Bacteroidales bacterium]|nr:helix-turn-helix domain-containing protein [Bacteroidales bacterium]MBK8883420.1 helix-turn-helix domain-containing protein [Bacteroidales bacterium]
MAAQLEKLVTKDDESFFIGIFQDSLEKCTWHYHNSYEISFITEGSGKRIVGDSIEEFQPGDLVFIGHNLPHVWIAEKETSTLSRRTLEMVYLQFGSDVLTPQLLALPEFRYVERALAMSERGIQIVGQTLNEVSELMLQLPYLKSFERMLHFLNLMNIIGSSQTNIHLASNEYIKKRFTTINKRIVAIHEYLMNNYREEVDLQKLARLVNMAEGSLCRFFKMKMGITLFDYLNQIKTDFACKLLMDPDMSILQICLDCGFNNSSNFNKQFKKRTGVTPTEYRKRFHGLI